MSMLLYIFKAGGIMRASKTNKTDQEIDRLIDDFVDYIYPLPSKEDQEIDQLIEDFVNYIYPLH